MSTSLNQILVEVAARLGIPVHLEPRGGDFGQLTLPGGRHSYFAGGALDVNGLGSATIAKFKPLAAYFLSRLGYPVPIGQAFVSERWRRQYGQGPGRAAAYAYARLIGWPVIVKPASRGSGIAVARVYNRRELDRALSEVFHAAGDPIALVQRPVPGVDYRITVLDDQIVAAYRRIPLTVVGDGRATLRELLRAHGAKLRQAGHPYHLRLDDFRLRNRLRRVRLTWESVLEAGARFRLLETFSLGGQIEEATEQLHEGYRTLAIQLARDMGLRFVGIDLMTPLPIEAPPTRYSILELNAAPFLGGYAASGARQRQVVADAYAYILRAISRLEGPCLS
jgi:D-alanine-D-alanine ligase-like ATP-grasp enzyme